MKRVIVNTGKIGLVFRKGNYKRVLTEGIYWIRANDKVIQYDMAKPFCPPVELNLLLKDKELTAHLNIVEVSDNEEGVQKGYQWPTLRLRSV